MNMKKCIKCNIEKEFNDFSTRKISKDGYRNDCKECQSLYHKSLDKDKVNSRNRNYHLNNKDKVNTKNREYYNNNKDIISIRNREYYKNNKDEKIISTNLYRNKRMKNDNLYKLKLNIRCSISSSIRNQGYTKKSRTHEILGCSYEDFSKYLESKFETWMTWENKGLYNGSLNFGWDMDHIIPVSSAKTEEEVIKLNHYTNFQPLCSKVNRDIKKDKLNYAK